MASLIFIDLFGCSALQRGFLQHHQKEIELSIAETYLTYLDKAEPLNASICIKNVRHKLFRAICNTICAFALFLISVIDVFEPTPITINIYIELNNKKAKAVKWHNTVKEIHTTSLEPGAH